MSAKAESRALARERLSGISAASRIELGTAIAERLARHPAFEKARVILLYASLPTEVPTDAIAAEARRRGIEVAYPRCLPEGEMTLHRVAGDAELRVGGLYGLREPVPECRLTRVEELDLALIPGLAWDRSGNRLGRGAGYYDRLFASPRWRAHRCGLFFAGQELPSLPVDAWDVKLHSVVTEKETVFFGREGAL